MQLKELNTPSKTMSENANRKSNTSLDWSTFPKDRHHTWFQTHARQFKFECTRKQLHTRNVRQKSTIVRGRERERERDRREERGGMERIILSTEKQVESWIRPKHLQADTEGYCTHILYSIMKCKYRPGILLSYLFKTINRKNVVYHRH